MDKDQSLKYVAGADVFSSEGDARSQIHVKLQHIFYKENPDGFMYKRRFLFYNRIAPI